jgi:RNA polymerase sigma factor (sigma-70 family)
MDQLEIKNVIAAAKKQDQKAFSILFDLYWDVVYTSQLKTTQDENVAGEIALLTFSKAFDRIAQYDDTYAFSTWILTIGKNLSIDQMRKKQRNQEQWKEIEELETEISDAHPSPEERLIASQNLDHLLQCIQKIKEEYRQLLHLRFFEGYSYKALSEELQQPINTIKVKLMRAKKILSEQIHKS